MTKKKSSSLKKYKSPSTGENCTAAQYITEVLLTRRASRHNQSLPHKFWNKNPWKKDFFVEIMRVHSLLKKYPQEAVILAVNSTKGKYILSCKNENLIPIIEEEVKKITTLSTDNVEEYQDNTMSKPRQVYGQQNSISKLRRLE